MYDRFFAERPLIPAGRYHEIAFEDLERDPVGQLREIYAKLDLPDFSRGRDAGAAVRRVVVGLPDERISRTARSARVPDRLGVAEKF